MQIRSILLHEDFCSSYGPSWVRRNCHSEKIKEVCPAVIGLCLSQGLHSNFFEHATVHIPDSRLSCRAAEDIDTALIVCSQLIWCREGKPLGSQTRIGEGCSFHSFRTNNYKLHFFESPSGIKVCCLENTRCSDMTYPTRYAVLGPLATQSLALKHVVGHIGPHVCHSKMCPLLFKTAGHDW